jgi:hypothetical protein
VLPLPEFALEAHALGDLEVPDDSPLDLLAGLSGCFAGPPPSGPDRGEKQIDRVRRVPIEARLKQRLGVGFLLGVDLLSVRRRVVGRRRAGHSRDGPEGKGLWPRRMVIPVRALLLAVERVSFVHFLGEIRIGVAAHRIRLHRFRRADFRHFCRRNRSAGHFHWLD